MIAQPWPHELATSRTAAVIDRAITSDRLGHSLLLHAENAATLEAAALTIADKLLNPSAAPQKFSVLKHPDCFCLRPKGKARQIVIGEDARDENTMRWFIHQLGLSAQTGGRKVGIVFDAEQMNKSTANAFLKTLEEPAARTTILVLTTQPYSLLPTIRSRCMNFRFPSSSKAARDEIFSNWLADYSRWLQRLVDGVGDKKAQAHQILSLYALITRFELHLEASKKMRLSEQAEAARMDTTAPQLDDDELEAAESSIAIGLRKNFLAEIAGETRRFLSQNIARSDELRAPAAIVLAKLEECSGLLRANLSTTVALEEFFLTALRQFAQVGMRRR